MPIRVAIYSTIDVARALLDSGMLRATLIFGALLVGVTILTLGLKTRSRASLRRPGGVFGRVWLNMTYAGQAPTEQQFDQRILDSHRD